MYNNLWRHSESAKYMMWKVTTSEEYAIGPDFVGKGYRKQILNAHVNYARDELGAKRFNACCRVENIASHNLQMSCGFIFSHSEEKADPRNGERYVIEHNFKEL